VRREDPRASAEPGPWSEASAAPPFADVGRAFDAAVTALLARGADVDLIRLAVLDVEVVGDGEAATTTHAAITTSGPHPLGQQIVVTAAAAGLLVRVAFLARLPRRRLDAAIVAGAKAEADAAFVARPPLLLDVAVVAADAPARFAEALGCRDPLHLDDDVARMAGLPGPVLPLGGLVILAATALARVGDGTGVLTRLHLEPRHPVLGGDRLRFEARGARGVDGDIELRIVNQVDVVVAVVHAEVR
jgi:acyl dehydratase